MADENVQTAQDNVVPGNGAGTETGSAGTGNGAGTTPGTETKETVKVIKNNKYATRYETYNNKVNKNMNTIRAGGTGQSTDSTDGSKLFAVVSTNISVYSNGQKLGFIQSIKPSESRNITAIQELGTEGVVQMVPGNTSGGQLDVSRFAVYNSTLFNALGLTNTGQFVSWNERTTDKLNSNSISGTVTPTSSEDSRPSYGSFSNPFKTLKDQRVPIEVEVRTHMPNKNATEDDEGNTFVETYIDCWLSSYSKSISAQNITITENATIQYSDVRTIYETSSSN